MRPNWTQAEGMILARRKDVHHRRTGNRVWIGGIGGVRVCLLDHNDSITYGRPAVARIGRQE